MTTCRWRSSSPTTACADWRSTCSTIRQADGSTNARGCGSSNEPTASNLPELNETGMKVLHVPDFDYETHHLTFVSALRAIATWSDAHPRHLPLFIQIESKASTVAEVLTNQGFTVAAPFDAAASTRWTARSCRCSPGRASSRPTSARSHATLDEAVTTQGWPLVEACRGRILLFMEGPAVQPYLAGAPGLAGRLIFAQSMPGDAHRPSCSATTRSAAAPTSRIRGRGYIVRTMADSSTVEARSGDRTRMNAASRRRAHRETDYYRPDPRGSMPGSGWSNYTVALPGAARRDPTRSARAAAPPVASCDWPRGAPPPSHRAPVLSASVGEAAGHTLPARCRLVEKLGVSRRERYSCAPRITRARGSGSR